MMKKLSTHKGCFIFFILYRKTTITSTTMIIIIKCKINDLSINKRLQKGAIKCNAMKGKVQHE